MTTSPRSVARAAGAGYLVIIVAGILAEFVVRGRLIVAGDAEATAANIADALPLFRAGIAGDLVMLVADVCVAAALYVLFRPVSRNLALLAAAFRVAHAAAYGASLLTLYAPALLLDPGGSVGAMGATTTNALVLLSLQLHTAGYVIALVFFGVHCLVVAAIIWRSAIVPRILGVLLAVAGVGYLLDSFARTVLANYSEIEPLMNVAVFVPAFVGELAFCLWLLTKGVRVVRETSAKP